MDEDRYLTLVAMLLDTAQVQKARIDLLTAQLKALTAVEEEAS